MYQNYVLVLYMGTFIDVDIFHATQRLCKEFDKGNTEYLHLEMLLHLEMSIVWRIGE